MPCWCLSSLSRDKRIAYRFFHIMCECHLSWPFLGACRRGSCLQSTDPPSGLAHYSKRTPMLLYKSAEDRHAGKVNPVICYSQRVLATRLFPLSSQKLMPADLLYNSRLHLNNSEHCMH